MGHYLPARFYGLRATLPYFIPLPVSPVGTMGAVIKIQEAIPDKKQLFDIGVGGPLASLILSSKISTNFWRGVLTIPCKKKGISAFSFICKREYVPLLSM